MAISKFPFKTQIITLILLIIVLILCVSATLLPELADESFESLQAEASLQELNITSDSTIEEIVQAINTWVSKWEDNAYLHGVELSFLCRETVKQPRSVFLIYIANKRRLVFFTHQMLITVRIDLSSESMVLRGTDVGDSGPPDSRLDLGLLERDFDNLWAVANSEGGSDFQAQWPDCTISAWLWDEIWRFHYAPTQESLYQLEIQLDALSGQPLP